MYLLDTNVISEMRKMGTRRADPVVQRWVDRTSVFDSYISAISILEIETGIQLLMKRDPAQANVLWKWLHGHVLPSYDGRIISVDTIVALRCAKLHVPVTMSYMDALIGATALVQGMTVVTRNVKDFEPMGVKVLNPWTDLAD